MSRKQGGGIHDSATYTAQNRESTGAPSIYDKSQRHGLSVLQGVFIGKVRDFNDETYSGYVHVELVNGQSIIDGSTAEGRQRTHRVRQLSPFGGVLQGDDHTNVYGMTASPPAPGTEVLVAFTGFQNEGYLLGVLNDAQRNAQIPGLPARQVEGETGGTIGPTFEPGVQQNAPDANAAKGPRHPMANNLAKQGLGLDAVRGVGSSGARRESPSNVTGMLTPGGHGLVLDDGTISSNGSNHVPDKDREAGISKLVRLRSAGGAQLLLNDTDGCVYVINQDGTSWIQMDKTGKIDVFSEMDISMHATNDFNLYVGGDFNLDADCINLKSRGNCGINMQTTLGTFDVHSAKDIRLTSDMNGHISCAGGNVRITGKMVDLNGPVADKASKPVTGNLTSNQSVKESIAGRVPEHEPWGGHEESSNAIPSQANSSYEPDNKDYDVSKISERKGPSRGSTATPKSQTSQTGIGSEPTTVIDKNSINPRTGLPWNDAELARLMQEPESVYDDAILREARRAANIGIELVDPEPILNQMYTGRSGPDDGLRGNIKGAVDAGKNFFKGQQQ
jgi:hypothetical protein|tara:strand:+ start:8374 stop:10056 length:1683 start_codon:yes stop_codon:yes gene_type:complete